MYRSVHESSEMHMLYKEKFFWQAERKTQPIAYINYLKKLFPGGAITLFSVCLQIIRDYIRVGMLVAEGNEADNRNHYG